MNVHVRYMAVKLNNCNRMLKYGITNYEDALYIVFSHLLNFIPFRSKYSSHYRVFKHSESVSFP
jgi:hypothetical protein